MEKSIGLKYANVFAHTHTNTHTYIYIFFFYKKNKNEDSLLWCHYKFISGRDDHHQMLYERKLFGCYLFGFFILLPARMGFEKKKSNFLINIIFNQNNFLIYF